MKNKLALFLTMLLLMSVASADPAVQAPPDLHLVNDDITFATSTGNYGWTYPTDTPDEWCGVEACGMAPTDPYVFENIEHLFLIDETEFALDWGDNSPDKVEVIGWENAVFQDVEHAGDYQDTYLELTDWKVVLKPGHVYSIQARWLESEEEKVSHGSAFYYIVTESTAALPAYSYTGDDPIVGVIINALLTDGHADMYMKKTGSVTIPCPIILKTEMIDEAHAKVYGNFWLLTYVKNGDVLENISGGENAAIITLEKVEGKWQVTAMEEAGDGEEYVADIKRFASGDSELETKYFAAEDLKANQETRTQFIKAYVEANDLDITAYQDYGWEPITLK